MQWIKHGKPIMKQSKKTKPSTSTQELIAQIQAAGLYPPEAATIMVTGQCNLDCRHCLLDCGALTNASPVDASILLPVINDLARLGITSINLTGGEILTHPEWHRILDFCLNHDRIKRVCLQTNATLITSRHLKALLDLQLDKLTIQVSLDGARPRTHNLIRGPGSYARVIAALHLLVEVGLGERTQVAFTEMEHNFHELPELLEKLDKMGIGRLISSTLIKGGRAATSATINPPIPAQYWELIQLYQCDAKFKALCDQKANIAAIEWFKNRSETSDSRCGCLKELFVDAQGRIFPCTMLLMERFASQSVHTRPLRQIIPEMLQKWGEIPTLSRKRQNDSQPCSRCTFRKHCGGGCMGRAATIRGELMGPEDRCSLRKAVYNWIFLPSAGAFCRRR